MESCAELFRRTTRYGKTLVIDLLDIDLWDIVRDKFDAIRAGLFEDLLDNKVIRESCYAKLIKPEDGDAYKLKHWIDQRTENFRVLFITTVRYPDDDMLATLLPIEVVPQPPSL